MMATADLTAARLRELLNYDELTGNFTWRHPGKKRRLDRPAGCVKAPGYIVIRVDGVLLRAHRLAWLYVHGKWPALEIDHIDGNPSNNVLANLREADSRMNKQNRHVARSDSSTGIMGVQYDKKRGLYSTRIQTPSGIKFLGRFADPLEAQAVYLAAKRTHHAGCTI